MIMCNSKLPVPISKLAGSVLAPIHKFTSKNDFSYSLFQDLDKSNETAKQSIFTGSLFRMSKFKEMDFSRCDFEGVRVEGCLFTDCDFSTCDIRSTIFSKVDFKNCVFADALIDASIFNECEFRNCNFDGTLTTKSSFNGGTIVNCRTTASSNISNKYSKVDFKATKLADCTFLFHIMRDCTFENVSINADALGTIYGISREELSHFTFYFLGETQKTDNLDSLFETISKTYLEKNWLFKYIFFNISEKKHNTSWLIGQFFEAIEYYCNNSVVVQADELQFANHVFEELAKEGRLPLAPFIHGIQRVHNLATKYPLLETPSKFTEFARNLHYLVDSDLTDSQFKLHNLKEYHFQHPIILFLTLKNEAEIEPDVLLNKLSEEFCTFIFFETSLIETSSGSIIYKLKATIGSVLLLYVLLQVTNGCMKELHELRAHIDILLNKEIPKSYRDKALNPEVKLPKGVKSKIGKLLTGAQASAIIEAPTLKGYSIENILNIRVETTDV